MCVIVPPIAVSEEKKKKRKFVHPLSFLLAENSKEGGRSSCFMFGLEED